MYSLILCTHGKVTKWFEKHWTQINWVCTHLIQAHVLTLQLYVILPTPSTVAVNVGFHNPQPSCYVLQRPMSISVNTSTGNVQNRFFISITQSTSQMRSFSSSGSVTIDLSWEYLHSDSPATWVQLGLNQSNFAEWSGSQIQASCEGDAG